MRKSTIALVLLMSSVAWVSCKKTKSTPTPDPVYPAGIHAKINGVAWTAAYINKVTLSGGGHYSVQFDGPDNLNLERISIELPDFNSRGIHTLSATSTDKAYYSLDTNFVPVPVYATSGQVNITALTDSSVGGTFYFTAGSKTITDGTFNISL